MMIKGFLEIKFYPLAHFIAHVRKVCNCLNKWFRLLIMEWDLT